jgi:hypothetical protein
MEQAGGVKLVAALLASSVAFGIVAMRSICANR